jgi:SAM-dependent methyltransferase
LTRLRHRLSPLYRRVRALPPVGMVRFGSLRRLTPTEGNYGFGRGKPVDRYYIDQFLRERATGVGGVGSLIRGRALEIGDTRYLDAYGDRNRLERLDVLDVSTENPKATVIADLADAPQLPDESYDWIICAQTLLLIYDVRAAISTLCRILRPEGKLLLTVSGISQICRPEMDDLGDYWRFTTRSVRNLLEETFDPDAVFVQAYGNVLTASCFLYGIAAEELDSRELDHHDRDYQLLIGAQATKREGPAGVV